MNRATHSKHSGFSLIELMIAMTIGLLLLSGLTVIFVSSSDVSREMQKTSQQIENGRYAIDVISQDLRLAGFYGHLHDLTALPVPGTIPPDPCVFADTVELRKDLRFPVQGYRGTIDATTTANDLRPDISATSCTGLLTAANLKKGSDVLVIRRADTHALTATEIPTADVLYIQATSADADIQVGGSTASVAVGTDKNAKGATSALYLSNTPTSPPAAPIRQFHVSIYFVAPCSRGSAASGACTGAAGEDTIPTLKRLNLSTTTAGMTIDPLVEGIEYFKIEYGVDTTPTAVNIATGYIGDGTVDSYTEAPADWTIVISAKLFLLARNTTPTTGFADTKTYKLGVSAADNYTVPVQTGVNAPYKRHVYNAVVRMVNPAGRREIP